MSTLHQIRFLIERQVKEELEDADVLNWCNEVNADIGTNINVPADAYSITLNTTDLEYALPANLKIINRLRLQSLIDQGIDAEIVCNYRIYNGNLILPRVLWIAPDELVVDYYKHLTYFTDIMDDIDIPDRLQTVYTFYGFMKYYGMPSIVANMGELSSRRMADNYAGMYANMRNQVISYYSLSDEPTVVDGGWGR
jgi:hypothetical protein